MVLFSDVRTITFKSLLFFAELYPSDLRLCFWNISLILSADYGMRVKGDWLLLFLIISGFRDASYCIIS